MTVRGPRNRTAPRGPQEVGGAAPAGAVSTFFLPRLNARAMGSAHLASLGLSGALTDARGSSRSSKQCKIGPPAANGYGWR